MHHFIIICEFKLELRVVTSVTLTFDLWPFAWTSLLSLVITPENFMMIRWEHSQKGVTDRHRRTENTIHVAAWSQLKIGHLFYTTTSFVHCIIAICVFKLELQSGNHQIGAKFVLTSVTLTFCMDITFVKGNNSWIFHHDTMTGTLWKRSNRWTDGLKWSQLKITVISPRGQWVQDYFHPQHIFQPQVTTDKHMDVCTF